MRKTQAQGTIEYLLIIAIIIIIALVVVGIMTEFLSPAQGVGQSINKVSNWSNSLALTETSVTPDGNYLIRLANNSGDEITISNVKIGNTNADYSQDLFQGNAQNFVIDSSDACSTGNGTTNTVTITYVSKYGITKTEVYPADTYFSCENYTVELLADQCDSCEINFIDPVYVVDGDTVTDTVNGLMWQTANYGGDGVLNWQAALDYCNNNTANLPGSGWRLPNIIEVGLLYDNTNLSCYAPFTDVYYWSSTSVAGKNSDAYALDYMGAAFIHFEKTSNSRVKCVRTI